MAEMIPFQRKAEWAEAEFLAGYIDGRDPESLPPGENRSHCYRHAFLNGRDDLSRTPRAAASALREMAVAAFAADMASEAQE